MKPKKSIPKESRNRREEQLYDAYFDGYDITLDQEEERSLKKERQKQKKQQQKKKRNRNKEFLVVTYSFLALFLCMCGYLCYFIAYESPTFITSSYNKRGSALSATTIRGDIYAADDTLLATSTVDENQEESRSYPQGEMYSHVVGYYYNGRSGLEKDANYLLLDSHEDYLEQFQYTLKGLKVQGDSIVTTLDHGMQSIAYNNIGNYSGAVIAMDPKTGAVKCMVSRPFFDPNTLKENWEAVVNDASSSRLINRCTQGLYAPGSTFKIVTALAYLQQGGSVEDTFQCNGSKEINGVTFHCFNGTSHGALNLNRAFAKSCNITFGTIGMEMDKDAYRKTAEELLFNQKLPTRFTNCNTSSFDVDGDTADDLAFQTAFGQGHTLVTPVHMAMIVSAVANDGVLMEPYLVDHSQNNEGVVVKQFQPKKAATLMSPEEASTLSSMMRSVVTEGTATQLNSDVYEAYGKTGTAEFTADKEEAHSWFVGYATDGDKELAIAVIIEEGGTHSALSIPLTKQIFDYYFAD
ncbi:MAG: penicillin-binding protein 2 [Lachnospiraceae bacterium]|nr:penicillin-binding protein 2 [Lachnospiraceae bacterium]